ncbi:MAG TPA: hypothetical protein VIN38_03940 [Thiobacillus sp.]
MKSTLAELVTLIERWTDLRRKRPSEGDFTPWGYSGISADDIDAMLASWRDGLEVVVNHTKSADQNSERIIDAFVSKLLRDTRPHIDNAVAQGMAWLIQSTPFMANIADISAHIRSVLAQRADLRKALLKIAASNLNDNLLSVEKVAASTKQAIEDQEKIARQKQVLEDVLKSASTIGEELSSIREGVQTSQAAIAASLTSATNNQEDLQEQSEALNALLEEARAALAHIQKQKKDADDTIAAGTPLLSAANEQLTKALQDINRQGLAGAFAKQAENVAGERRKWVLAFGLSISWLGYVAYNVVFTEAKTEFDPLSILRGLPLAAPAIWLGWFSARQTGMLARIEQDYAYKASTAVAFEGYKKEVMDANDEALSKQLLETAVSNFGDNPVRLYANGSDNYGHPIEALVEKIQDAETRTFVVDLLRAVKPDFKK